jgi:hypothetical protein
VPIRTVFHARESAVKETSMRSTRRLIAVFGPIFVIALTIVLINPFATHSMRAASVDYYVSPAGTDTNAGTDASKPFKSIQHALDLAQPGARITLAPGVYAQDIRSVRDGAPNAPITLTGPADAVIHGGGAARIIEINHDYLALEGFTVDGLWSDPNSLAGYRDKLLYVLGKQPLDGVSGLRVVGMTFRNAGGECIRLRYFAEHNEIANSNISNCGVHDFRFSAGGKNGEGIYIGTAPEQRGDGKSPTADPDLSNANWIHDNIFNTQGNECVDIKESATGNIIENNRCTGQRDPESGGFDSRGSGNIFRANESYGNAGAGMRLGGDAANDGIGNDVYANSIHDNQAGGIKFQRQPQGQVCGNAMSNNSGGDAVGTYAAAFAPAARCSTPPPDATTVPGATSVPPIATAMPASTSVPPSATVTPTPPASIPTSVLPSTSQTGGQSLGCIYAIDGAHTSAIEAERFSSLRGRLGVVADVQQSGGEYLSVVGEGRTRDPNTYASYNLTIANGGTFVVWLRGYGPNGSSDSFYIQFDNGKAALATVTQGQWGWKRLSSRFKLADGPHTFTLKHRENGANADKLLLTRDREYRPTGLGEPALPVVCR